MNKDSKLLAEAYETICEDAKFAGETVEIDVPIEWMELAYKAYEENSSETLVEIMKKILSYKGDGMSTRERYDYIMKLSKNNTRPAVDGIRSQKDSKLRSDLPGKPYSSSGWTGAE